MTQTKSEKIIEARSVGRVFRHGGTETVALDEVSLTIDRGEFVSIMGKSGSGKSTLLYILGFLDRPNRGEYWFFGENTGSFSEERLAGLRNFTMGFVFQSFYLLPRSTVLENVMLPLVYSRIPGREHAARAQRALEQVDLGHRLEHRPTQLSGGEKQRVAIARALVNEPDIIFADEPTGNLDSQTGELVMRTIDRLHETGHTIILVTHERATASFARRIVELRDGRVLSDETNAGRHERYEK